MRRVKEAADHIIKKLQIIREEFQNSGKQEELKNRGISKIGISKFTTSNKFRAMHWVKPIRILGFSSPYFAAFRLNTGQKNSEYGQFSYIDAVINCINSNSFTFHDPQTKAIINNPAKCSGKVLAGQFLIITQTANLPRFFKRYPRQKLNHFYPWLFFILTLVKTYNIVFLHQNIQTKKLELNSRISRCRASVYFNLTRTQDLNLFLSIFQVNKVNANVAIIQKPVN